MASYYYLPSLFFQNDFWNLIENLIRNRMAMLIQDIEVHIYVQEKWLVLSFRVGLMVWRENRGDGLAGKAKRKKSKQFIVWVVRLIHSWISSPCFNSMIIASREECIGIELDEREDTRLISINGSNAFPRGGIPDFNGPIVGSCRDFLLVEQIDCVDGPGVSLECLQLRSTLPIPENDHRIIGSGEEQVRPMSNAECSHGRAMSNQILHVMQLLLQRLEEPDTNSAIVTRRRKYRLLLNVFNRKDLLLMRSFLQHARLNDAETHELLILIVDQEQVTISTE